MWLQLWIIMRWLQHRDYGVVIMMWLQYRGYYDVVTVYGVIMMWLQYRELLLCGYSIGSYYDVVTV